MAFIVTTASKIAIANNAIGRHFIKRHRPPTETIAEGQFFH
jgi:hypothetical protein